MQGLHEKAGRQTDGKRRKPVTGPHAGAAPKKPKGRTAVCLSYAQNLCFQKYSEELLKSADVRSMDGFLQHAGVTCLEHSFSVARTSLWLGEKLRLQVDRRSLIRGALLHDFFLYDWHLKSNRKGLHGFTHPKTALKNAEERFFLTDIERDIIIKHMWPLTPAPPKYTESFLVGCADKLCSLREILRMGPLVK